MAVSELFGLKRRRGFSYIDNRVSRLAGRKGGVAAHGKKKKSERCHEWSSETARAAVLKRWAAVKAAKARKLNAA